MDSEKWPIRREENQGSVKKPKKKLFLEKEYMG